MLAEELLLINLRETLIALASQSNVTKDFPSSGDVTSLRNFLELVVYCQRTISVASAFDWSGRLNKAFPTIIVVFGYVIAIEF